MTYERRGDGEPVVFIHPGAFVPLYRPLIEQLGELSTLWYRRRIAGDGNGGFRPFVVGEDAAICARVLDHVGVPMSSGTPTARSSPCSSPSTLRNA